MKDLLRRKRDGLQPFLRCDEPLHHLEVAVAQLQASVSPNLDDTVKLGERKWIDLASDLIDRAVANVAALAALDVFARFGEALSRLGQNVHEANVFHFFRGVDAPTQHHFFGKGCAHTARHQTVSAHAREQTEDVFRKTELRAALGDDDVMPRIRRCVLYFQPLVDLRTGRVTTCEALMRWKHPNRGMVPPAVFIPIAEETGLIISLGEWALQRACAEAANWPKSVKVAVNLSPVQFRDRGLALHVVSALAKSGLPAQRLELEVTERLLLEDSDGTLATMEQLKNLGVSISLDDFGTGYSSLNYLRKFPFQKIKIDQSFIQGLGEERDAQAIIGAVAGLGASLDKTVVAEGIETEEQMRQVKAHGCHEGQGHFFGEPMTAETIHARLAESTSVAQLVA